MQTGAVLSTRGESNDYSARTIIDYYRCPENAVSVGVAGELCSEPDFFRFGDITCYGRYASSFILKESAYNRVLQLPFDLTEVVNNLRLERYMEDSGWRKKRLRDSEFVRRAYYGIRHLLPSTFRHYLHKIHLDGWREISFPCWPIDTSVDRLIETALRRCLLAFSGEQMPFIWFWPQAYPACAVMTHDIEHEEGRAFCLDLLRMDQSYGIKSSFQVIPEGRYDAGKEFIDTIKDHGFEVNVHDLNHDGHLFKSRRMFLERVSRLNSYGKEFGALGFRSGSMYRKVEWLAELDFAYDMSIPNAAHLEPQSGGCCTIMPFTLGQMVELPLTVTQDYSLFRIFEDYSIDLWEEEIQYLIRKHGLINIIVHPDYVIDRRARDVYGVLLQRLADLRNARKLWMTLPGEAARWWKLRSRMRLEKVDGEWTVIGEGSENATVAYAYLDDGQLSYRVGNDRFHVSEETILQGEAVRSLS